MAVVDSDVISFLRLAFASIVSSPARTRRRRGEAASFDDAGRVTSRRGRGEDVAAKQRRGGVSAASRRGDADDRPRRGRDRSLGAPADFSVSRPRRRRVGGEPARVAATPRRRQPSSPSSPSHVVALPWNIHVAAAAVPRPVHGPSTSRGTGGGFDNRPRHVNRPSAAASTIVRSLGCPTSSPCRGRGIAASRPPASRRPAARRRKRVSAVSSGRRATRARAERIGRLADRVLQRVRLLHHLRARHARRMRPSFERTVKRDQNVATVPRPALRSTRAGLPARARAADASRRGVEFLLARVSPQTRRAAA